MKKNTVLISTLALLSGNIIAQDKAFEKGNIVVELGTGFGLYGTKSHQERNEQQFNLATGFHTVRVVEDTTDAAVSAIYPLTFEYGVTNWLGLGARFAYANYLGQKDSTTNNKPKVTGIDADLLMNIHLIKTEHFDMPVRVTVGYSSFRYLANDNLGSMAKDNGINFGIALIPRIYFGNHFGIFFNVGYAGYNYPSLKFSNDKDSNINNDNDQDLLFKLKGNGANIGVGLVVKI